MAINHVSTIIDGLGHDHLIKLGLTERNIRHAKSVGGFSALWYLPIKEAMDSQGLACPLGAFRFKDVAKNNGKSVDFKAGVGNS